MQLDLYLSLSIFSFVLFLFMLFLYLKQKDISGAYLSQNSDLQEELQEIQEEKQTLTLNHVVLNTRYEEEIKSSNTPLNCLNSFK